MTQTADYLATTQCLCLASRRAARAITRRFDRGLRPHGLRATQFSLLSGLILKGPQAIGELADLLGAERTTMTRNLAVVEAAGFVTIRPGEDARARIVAITPRGREVLAAALPDWKRIQAELSDRIGQPAADGLRRLSGGPSLLLARPPPDAGPP